MKNRKLTLLITLILLMLVSTACGHGYEPTAQETEIYIGNNVLEMTENPIKPPLEAEAAFESGKNATPSLQTPSGVVEEFFKVWSTGVALNSATSATTFTTTNSWFVTEILTYHWNDGNGKPSGTIGLQASDGTVYGPWQATAIDGSGVTNVAWVVHPNFILAPGTYTVLDSDPVSWSQNEETSGAGMAWGLGIRQSNP